MTPQVIDKTALHALAKVEQYRQQGAVSEATSQRARKAFLLLAESMQFRMPEPQVWAGGQAQILFEWNSAERHFEMEVLPEGEIEFYYSNQTTKETWEAYSDIRNPIPAEILEKASLLCSP
ncbi:MAG: hypothetical protein NT023_21930 [Armatimonadetes bacterium]|nr:hypothetical protein [Armatimonadota bacterium]